MKTKQFALLITLVSVFSAMPDAQAQSTASKNNLTPVAVSNASKTAALTISLTAKGDYVLASEQDKNLHKSGKLGSATDIEALNKKLQEMRNGTSDVSINIKAGQGVKFRSLIDVASTALMQTVDKFTITTETSQCTVRVPADSPVRNAAYLSVQIDANGDYAMQLSDKDGKLKDGNISNKHEKMTRLADAIVQAKKSNPGVYALISADKESPIQAYVDLINMLHSASIDKYMIVVQSAGNSTRNTTEDKQLKTQQLRVTELEAQQKQLLEQLKKMK
ncbi:biopolymer transporter ExbD [Undibacterium sp. TS12]|uniref:ExbD/TolR family protein n=1 Tax=Undibacterium sp. TS12 TaxID=2908202 RepID=UPI001F4CFB54|nr:biopolymer transporter ExbD [Undibacterium sp. TS12]MCH8621009.1 biopolymer transporter ExbD [Undibacterium sp. TS12]